MVPGKICNFHCIYCEVNRTEPGQGPLDVAKMAEELKGMLGFIQNGDIARHPQYCSLPGKLLELRQVALSGDGEPTLAPNFLEAVMAVIHVRATSMTAPFKLILITNGSGLDQPNVQQAAVPNILKKLIDQPSRSRSSFLILSHKPAAAPWSSRVFSRRLMAPHLRNRQSNTTRSDLIF